MKPPIGVDFASMKGVRHAAAPCSSIIATNLPSRTSTPSLPQAQEASQSLSISMGAAACPTCCSSGLGAGIGFATRPP